MKFYIDSANPDDIEFALTKMQMNAPRSLRHFGGITTNPNALTKAGITTYPTLISHLHVLDTLLQKWLYDLVMSDEYNGTGERQEIHVQLPISTMTPSAAKMFIEAIQDLRLKTAVVFKFPPIPKLLTSVKNDPTIDINVTGLTSAQDCELMFAFPRVMYASLIPGRMEEVGIDVQPHLDRCKEMAAIRWADACANQFRVISGSMRTPYQVIVATQANTLPTVGRKVWELMTSEDCMMFHAVLCGKETITPVSDQRLLPLFIDERHTKLTNDFFNQMDTLGQPIFETFVENKVTQYTQNFL